MINNLAIYILIMYFSFQKYVPGCLKMVRVRKIKNTRQLYCYNSLNVTVIGLNVFSKPRITFVDKFDEVAGLSDPPVQEGRHVRKAGDVVCLVSPCIMHIFASVPSGATAPLRPFSCMHSQTWFSWRLGCFGRQLPRFPRLFETLRCTALLASLESFV